MKNVAKHYKEYQLWVEKLNIKKAAKTEKLLKDWNVQEELDKKEFKKRLKRWERMRAYYVNRAIKRQKEWDNKSWLDKLFSEKQSTYIPFEYEERSKPKDHSMFDWPPFYFGGTKESLEGFYKWLAEVKYK